MGGQPLRHCLVAALLVLLWVDAGCASERAGRDERNGVEPGGSAVDDVDAALNVVNTLIQTAAESAAQVGWCCCQMRVGGSVDATAALAQLVP